MVMSWLINSMTTEIRDNFLLSPTAKDIGVAARDTYSCTENDAELFEIESRLHELKQDDESVTHYFSTLDTFCQQIDLYETYALKCPDDGKIYRAIIEKKRHFQFLLGLNNQFDKVCGRILASKPLPTLCKAFFKTRHEESWGKLMLGPSPLLEGSALVSHRAPLSAPPTADHFDSLVGNTSQSLNMSLYIPIEGEPALQESHP